MASSYRVVNPAKKTALDFSGKSDLSPKACKARGKNGEICALDRIHVELGSKHLHRNPDGSVVAFAEAA